MLKNFSNNMESFMSRFETEDHFEGEDYDYYDEDDYYDDPAPVAEFNSSFNPLQEIIDCPQSEGDFSEESEGVQVLQNILNETQSPPEYGLLLSQRVAEYSDMILLTHDVNREVLHKIKEQLKVPDNAKLLSAQRLNPELWRFLPRNIRSSDTKLQYLQQKISRGRVAQARATDLILKLASNNKLNKDEVSGISSLLVGSATSLGLAFREINNRS
jgi:hypothetical protein